MVDWFNRVRTICKRGIRTEIRMRYSRLEARALRTVLRLPELSINPSAAATISDRDFIHDDICLPPFFGPSQHDDLTPFLVIVKALNPKLAIELGTAHGNLTANLCRFSVARVITVNALPEQISGQLTTFFLAKDDIGRIYRRYGFSSRVVQVLANTREVNLAEHVRPESVNLAIIDACHDAQYVVSDFLNIAPFMSDGGIVLLHDTHPSMDRHLIGSYTGCMKLRGMGYDVAHIKNTWWGIWIKGGLSSSPASAIFSTHADPAVCNGVSWLFRRRDEGTLPPISAVTPKATKRGSFLVSSVVGPAAR